MFKPNIEDAIRFKNQANGNPVLYLDFDGVLHPDQVYTTTKKGIVLRAHGHQLFEGALILEEILAPYPDVKIVLSTSWVIVKGYSYARQQLLPSLSSRVIGATFHTRLMDRYEFLKFTRGQQIASDVNRRGAGAWLALDDDADGWPPYYSDRLVLCDSNLGLLCPKTRTNLAQMIQQQFSNE